MDFDLFGSLLAPFKLMPGLRTPLSARIKLPASKGWVERIPSLRPVLGDHNIYLGSALEELKGYFT